MKQSHDVIVVGAGPAGATLAYELAKSRSFNSISGRAALLSLSPVEAENYKMGTDAGM